MEFGTIQKWIWDLSHEIFSGQATSNEAWEVAEGYVQGQVLEKHTERIRAAGPVDGNKIHHNNIKLWLWFCGQCTKWIQTTAQQLPMKADELAEETRCVLSKK